MNQLSQTELAIKLIKNGKSLDEIMKDTKLPSLGTFLFDYVAKRNLSIEVAANLADLNKTSLYRIIHNEMKPVRNVLIRLSRILDMDIDETQLLLKCGNVASLSGSRPRDLCIMEGIIHNKCIGDINDLLTEQGFPDLFTKR